MEIREKESNQNAGSFLEARRTEEEGRANGAGRLEGDEPVARNALSGERASSPEREFTLDAFASKEDANNKIGNPTINTSDALIPSAGVSRRLPAATLEIIRDSRYVRSAVSHNDTPSGVRRFSSEFCSSIYNV